MECLTDKSKMDLTTVMEGPRKSRQEDRSGSTQDTLKMGSSMARVRCRAQSLALEKDSGRNTNFSSESSGIH